MENRRTSILRFHRFWDIKLTDIDDLNPPNAARVPRRIFGDKARADCGSDAARPHQFLSALL